MAKELSFAVVGLGMGGHHCKAILNAKGAHLAQVTMQGFQSFLRDGRGQVQVGRELALRMAYALGAPARQGEEDRKTGSSLGGVGEAAQQIHQPVVDALRLGGAQEGAGLDTVLSGDALLHQSNGAALPEARHLCDG